MTTRRWLKAAITEAARPQPAAVYSRQARLERQARTAKPVALKSFG